MVCRFFLALHRALTSGLDRPRHDPFAESYALRAPEIILDAPSDTSVDLWSLGCVVNYVSGIIV